MKQMGTPVITILLLALCVAFIYRSQPSVLDPVIWQNPFPLPALDGPYTPNELLTHSELLCEGECTAPESMAMDAAHGIVYASLNDGTVVSISAAGVVLSTVFFTGGYIASEAGRRTNGLSGFEDKLRWCKEESKANRLAWNMEGERSCGRPLGLRLIHKQLYILDAYHGLFRLDIGTHQAEHLITPTTEIKVPKGHTGDIDPVIMYPPRFFNDFDSVEILGPISGSEEGSLERPQPVGWMIYFSDSSYKHTRSQNRQEVLDGAPRGRVFSFDTRTSELEVLVCGLHFPNGVQVLNEHEILVVESARFRVLKINLKNLDHPNSMLSSCSEDGSLSTYLKSNTDFTHKKLVSVFLDEVPGFMDNIRPDTPPHSIHHSNGHHDKNHQNHHGTAKNKHFFIGIGTTYCQPFSLLYHLYQSIFLREIIGKVLPMKYVEKLIPKYGLALLVDSDGNVLETFHDTTGKKMKMLSEVQRHPVTGDIWLGSHSNPYIGRLSSNTLEALQKEKEEKETPKDL